MGKKIHTAAKLPRVLVICKKSAYQIYVQEHKNTRIERLFHNRDPLVKRLFRAHRDHVGSLERAKKTLERLGARATFRLRGETGKAEGADLVVSLGGDGTLLWTSHMVGPDCPVVAINTAPLYSLGHFCAGTKDNLEEVLEDALHGKLKPTQIARMAIWVDGKQITSRVLNDVLFSHKSPAATSRYSIHYRGRRQEQKSSGVWVGPAAGSTAAMHSAGGKVLPITSQRLQFQVRELFKHDGRGKAIRCGFVEPGEEFVIQSQHRKGCLYIDGTHLSISVGIGSKISMRLSNEPFILLGFRHRQGLRRNRP